MGSNYFGVLGTADTVAHPLPEPIGADTDWTAISIMDHYLNDTACGVRGGGLYCWGSEQSGVLGDPALAQDACNNGQRNCKYGPGRVGSDSGWSDVSVGFGFACGIRAGNLFCWGNDSDGKVGDGSPITPLCTALATCARFSTPIGPSGGFQQVSAGSTFACAIRSGELYCWGSDRSGQVGDGPGSDALCAQGCRWTPTRVGGDADWNRVSAGNAHACGIRRGGLFCWGMNEYGQLGDGTTENRDAPARVGVHTDWYDVSASKDFTCAIRQGELYCWGFNFSGETGDGGTGTEECTRGYPCRRLPAKVVRP
jgi:alpha-tubulin suppressor-like RCC1 family protein